MTLKVGDQAPEFELNDENGQPVKLSSLRGHNVVLVFYPLDFSPICTGELKAIATHKERYEEKGAKVLGISVDSRWAHGAFKKHEGLSATLLADFQPRGAVAQQYGVYLEAAGIAKRGTFVIDKEGVIRGITVNEPKQARNEDEYFAQLSACPI
jgi:peroxiredoxin